MTELLKVEKISKYSSVCYSVTFSGETLINLDPHAYVAGWVPRDWIKTNITRENSAREHFPDHRVVIPVSLKYLEESKVSMLRIRQSIT